jgi:hypothetical protein
MKHNVNVGQRCLANDVVGLFCRLIEEFMLLANMAVARKLYRTYPDLAVLRRHPPPQTRMIDDLVSIIFSKCRLLIIAIIN